MNGGVKPSGRHNQFNAEPDSIAMSQGGASAGHVDFMPIRFWAGAHCCVVTSKTPDVLTKHLFHVLKKRQGILMSSQTGGGHAIPGLRKAVLENLEISPPPIKEQVEIARILDTFAELATELEKEATLRRKQYNHYRDQLLNFDDISPWGGVIKPLEELAEIKRGTSITRKDVEEGGIPVIAGGRKPAYFHNASNRKGQTIFVAGSGAYAGYVTWWEQPIFVSDAFTVKPNAGILPKYCFYCLQAKQQMIHKMKKGVGVPHVYPRDVAQLPIHIPHPNDTEKSLSEQTRIVSILDKFHTLTNSLEVGLPREIELRQKQYEYYRDKLVD